MRFIPVVILITALPMFAQDLSFTLSSNSGAGDPPAIAADPGPPCLASACVLFSGTLTDNDTDGSYIFLGPQVGLGPDDNLNLNDIAVAFPDGPASGGLTLDNTWDDYADVGVLVGDPNGEEDVGVPNSYTGPLFGIDIAPGTTLGEYTGTVTISAEQFILDANGNFDPVGPAFTVTQEVTVDVTPEPATFGFALTGLAGLAVWVGLRRKWRSSAASR